jgi:hypothetical protein
VKNFFMALPSGAKWGSKTGGPAASTPSPAAAAHAVADEADASKKNLKKVVLDSGAIIKGRRLESLGDAFWTVRETHEPLGLVMAVP